MFGDDGLDVCLSGGRGADQDAHGGWWRVVVVEQLLVGFQPRVAVALCGDDVSVCMCVCVCLCARVCVRMYTYVCVSYTYAYPI